MESLISTYTQPFNEKYRAIDSATKVTQTLTLTLHTNLFLILNPYSHPFLTPPLHSGSQAVTRLPIFTLLISTFLISTLLISTPSICDLQSV